MVPSVRAITIAVVLGVVAACAPRDVLLTEPPPGYVQEAPARVATIDWSSAETVTVALSEFRFTPQKLVFRRGVPYRLRIENGGNFAHTFNAEGFFAAIAVQKLRSGETETVLPYVKNVVVAPREVKDLYFLAVVPGSYDLKCSVVPHDVLGMTGTVEIR